MKDNKQKKLTFNIFQHLSCLSHCLSSLHVASMYSHIRYSMPMHVWKEGEGKDWRLYKGNEETQFIL
jgi:hypothetical protein